MWTTILSLCGNGLGPQSDTDSLYDRLLESSLSSKCNDVSLILVEMSKLEARGWTVKFDQWNKDTLRKTTQSVSDFLRQLRGSCRHPIGHVARLKTVLDDAAAEIDSAVGAAGLDMRSASEGFLDMAVNIENFLLELLEEENGGVAPPQVQDLGQDLTAALESMGLESEARPKPMLKPKPAVLVKAVNIKAVSTVGQ